MPRSGPDLPLGSHTIPLAEGADRSPSGVAQLVEVPGARTLLALDAPDAVVHAIASADRVA